MTAVQSDTSRFDIQRSIEEIYRRLGALSEEERQSLLKSAEQSAKQEENEESYTISIGISTGG